MALYDYRCDAGHVNEVAHPAPPPGTTPCASCHRAARRVYSKPMVPLMGYDSAYRRRRRPMATDVTTSDAGKVRKVR